MSNYNTDSVADPGGFQGFHGNPFWNLYTLIEQSDQEVPITVTSLEIKCKRRVWRLMTFFFWSSTQTGPAFLSSWNWNPLSKILTEVHSSIHPSFRPSIHSFQALYKIECTKWLYNWRSVTRNRTRNAVPIKDTQFTKKEYLNELIDECLHTRERNEIWLQLVVKWSWKERETCW